MGTGLVRWIWLMKPHDHHHSMCTCMNGANLNLCDELITGTWGTYQNGNYYSLVYLRFLNCRMEVSG